MVGECQWSVAGDRFRCTVCGRISRWAARQTCEAYLPPPAESFRCRHLLEATRPISVECQTCGGMKIIEQPAHHCAVHGRCLPTYAPQGEQLEKWRARKPESEIYALCAGCGDRELDLPSRQAQQGQ